MREREAHESLVWQYGSAVCPSSWEILVLAAELQTRRLDLPIVDEKIAGRRCRGHKAVSPRAACASS